MDGSINPNSRRIAASAYSNNFAGAASTTLYGIDTSRQGGFLVIQDPNSGTLTDVGSLGLIPPSGATLDAGFDISGLTGIAYYTAYTGIVAGGGSLWRVNLATGRLSYMGLIGGEGTFQFLGLAAQVRTPVPEPATMILLGTGLAGIAAKVRRRRKDNQD